MNLAPRSRSAITRMYGVAVCALVLLGTIGAVRLHGLGAPVGPGSSSASEGSENTTATDRTAVITPSTRIPVRIRVRTATGEIVPGASIEVQDRFGRTVTEPLTTDARGEARFSASPTEGVRVRARKSAVGQVRLDNVTFGLPPSGQSTFDIDLCLCDTGTTASTVAEDMGTTQEAQARPTARVPEARSGAQPLAAGPQRGTVVTATVGPRPVEKPEQTARVGRLFVGHMQPRITTVDIASGTSTDPPVDLGGGRFTYLTASAGGRWLFASWGGSSDVVRMRTSDVRVIADRTRLNAGAVASLAVSPTTGHLWVASAGAEGQDNSNVIELDSEGTRVLRRISLVRRSGLLRFTDDGATLAVAHRGTSELSLVDIATGLVSPALRLPVWPGDLQFTDGGRSVVVGNQSSTVAYVVAIPSGETSRLIDVGSGVNAIALHPDGRRMLIVNGQLGVVQIMDRTTGDVLDVIPVGQQPQAILMRPGGREAYVANTGSGTVSVLDLERAMITDTIAVGVGASALALAP